MDGVVFDQRVIYVSRCTFFADLLISNFYFDKQAFAPQCGTFSGSIHFPPNPLWRLHFSRDQRSNLVTRMNIYKTVLLFTMSKALARVDAHIAQNIAEICQKYFQYFIAIKILPQHFRQLFQNISLQHYNFKFLKYFCK